MATTRETTQIRTEIGARIASLLERNKLDERALIRAGYSSEVLRKQLKGQNVAQFAKLIELANALKATPNDILGFERGDPRDAVIGIIEAVGLMRGLPPEQAAPFAEAVAKALDSLAIRSTGSPLRDTARTVGIVAIEKFFQPKQS